jgi:hypothetical protein
MIKLTETREITPHLWVHPDEERRLLAGLRRRVFLATSGTFARFVGCVGSSGGTGKPAVA